PAAVFPCPGPSPSSGAPPGRASRSGGPARPRSRWWARTLATAPPAPRTTTSRSSSRLASPIEPQGRDPVAVVEARIRGVVLDVGPPRGRERGRVQVHVVLLLGRVPLDVEDQRSARVDVLRAHLFL